MCPSCFRNVSNSCTLANHLYAMTISKTAKQRVEVITRFHHPGTEVDSQWSMLFECIPGCKDRCIGSTTGAVSVFPLGGICGRGAKLLNMLCGMWVPVMKKRSEPSEFTLFHMTKTKEWQYAKRPNNSSEEKNSFVVFLSLGCLSQLSLESSIHRSPYQTSTEVVK